MGGVGVIGEGVVVVVVFGCVYGGVDVGMGYEVVDD